MKYRANRGSNSNGDSEIKAVEQMEIECFQDGA